MSRPPFHDQAMTQRGIRISEEMWDELCRLAKKQSKKTPGHVSPSDLVREAVRRYIRASKRARKGAGR